MNQPLFVFPLLLVSDCVSASQHAFHIMIEVRGSNVALFHSFLITGFIWVLIFTSLSSSSSLTFILCFSATLFLFRGFLSVGCCCCFWHAVLMYWSVDDVHDWYESLRKHVELQWRLILYFYDQSLRRTCSCYVVSLRGYIVVSEVTSSPGYILLWGYVVVSRVTS